jgi:hypothetical protein
LGARAREHGGRKIAVAQKRVKATEREEEYEGNGVNPALAHTIYRGPPNLSVAAPCSVQLAPTALSREVHEKIEADFSLNRPSAMT